VFVFLANNDGEGNAAGCAQAAERLEPHGLHAREPRVPVPVLLVRRAARANHSERRLLDWRFLLRVGHEFSVMAKRGSLY